MKSLRELYRIGRGPSSSHTMAPERAAKDFLRAYPQADRYRAVLYGSFALTGSGHGTDRILREVLGKNAIVELNAQERELPHPNTMDLFAYRDGAELGFRRVISPGGGAVKIVGEDCETPDVYPRTTFSQIVRECRSLGIRLREYVELCEGKEIREYLAEVWAQMNRTVNEGLQAEGILPGGLEVRRRAALLFGHRQSDEGSERRESRLISAYAFAAGEQNASGGTVVTAPTCGACGVVPATLIYMQERYGFSDEQMIGALETAGLIGNLIKTNASISGAECGCQAEIGSACSMAAAGLCELFGGSYDQIECAAEMAMEHHLGLTCDPVCGLVQIPCIERNAMAALCAVNTLAISEAVGSTRKVSFDTVVATMLETGRDLPGPYRETARGGLAKLYRTAALEGDCAPAVE